MAQTTRGWPYPVGTDYVVDGDNAMRAISERLDSVLGLTRLATIDMTGLSAAIFDGYFSPNFWAYRIEYNIRVSGGANVNMNLRNAGVDVVTAGTYGNTRNYLSSASAMTAVYAAAATWTISAGVGTQINGGLTIAGLRNSSMQVQGYGQSAAIGVSGAGNQLVLWSGHVGNLDNFDGLRLLLSAGTGGTSSSATLYGMR